MDQIPGVEHHGTSLEGIRPLGGSSHEEEESQGLHPHRASDRARDHRKHRRDRHSEPAQRHSACQTEEDDGRHAVRGHGRRGIPPRLQPLPGGGGGLHSTLWPLQCSHNHVWKARLGLQRASHADLHPPPTPDGRLELVFPLRREYRQPRLRDLLERQRRLFDYAHVGRNDELQCRHRLHRRPVRSVPRGRAELIVLPLRPDPRAPLTGALFFSGPRIAAVRGRGTTGRTALLGGALGLAFASLLLLPCALSGGVPARGDLADFFWPMKAYTAARWHSGVPLWNPLSGCGEPWLPPLPTRGFLPGDPPFPLPGAWGPLFGIALHLAIASSGMAAWLSGLGTSRAGALLGAGVFAGGGGFLSLALVYNNFETASFLPWLFLAARYAVRGGSPAGLAVAFALAFLGGEPALAAVGAASAAVVAFATRGDEPGSLPPGGL